MAKTLKNKQYILIQSTTRFSESYPTDNDLKRSVEDFEEEANDFMDAIIEFVGGVSLVVVGQTIVVSQAALIEADVE